MSPMMSLMMSPMMSPIMTPMRSPMGESHDESNDESYHESHDESYHESHDDPDAGPLARLLGPAVVAVGVGAHVVQLHLRLRLLRVRLEEHGLPVPALGARPLVRPGQGGVPRHISDNVRDLVHLVHDLVDVDAAGVGELAVVAVPARVQQYPVILVLLGVEHVVALLAEPDAHEARPLGPRHLRHPRTLLKKVNQAYKL